MALMMDGRSVAQKIEDAKKLLEDHGYMIRGPITLRENVKTPADLVRFFYDKMTEYNPSMLMHYSNTRKRDLGMAKAFIEARQALGVSKPRAITECCALIETLFKHESKMGLNFKVSSMSILGQEALGWITDKLVDMVNGFNTQLATEQDTIWFEGFYREQEEAVPKHVVDEANKRLGLEENDGKK